MNIGAQKFLFSVAIQRPPCAVVYATSTEASRKIAVVWVKNEWNEITNNETRFKFTECFQMFSKNRTRRDTIHKTFGGLLTLYLNSHSVSGTLAITVDQFNFVFCTLRSLQCKDCNFCSCSIDIFLNTTQVNTFWNRCVAAYVMFVHNSEGGRAVDEL